jgi:hypothetical protein
LLIQLRKTFHKAILGETLPERCVSSRHRINPRGVERKMSTYPLRRRKTTPHAATRAADSDQKPLNEQYWA